MAPTDDVEVEVDETREIEPDKIVAVRILRVPESDKFSNGVKYGYHYAEKGADDPILRYENHHGVHERHEGDSVEELDEFPGAKSLLRRFLEEIGIEL